MSDPSAETASPSVSSVLQGLAKVMANNGIPQLENGDRLSRPEFGRRYAAMPRLKRAELIDGVVYIQPFVRVRGHGRPHARLIGCMGNYEAATPGVEVADSASMRLDLDNEPQPDGLLYVLPECGGQVTITEDDYLEGAAELVGEVASSSVSYDLGPKLNVYRKHGVREYVVWRVLDQAIDWFVLREGKYERLSPGEDGIHRSEVLPGLWLDAAAMIRGDLPRVQEVLQMGLKREEHKAFVARLEAEKAKKE